MHKVGDKFKVVSGGFAYGVKVGDIVTWLENAPGDVGYFKSSSGKIFPAAYSDNSINISTTVRPLRTEAEKRGAKFGVGGVIKSEGIRVVFTGVREDKCSTTGSEVWRIVREDSPFVVLAECHSEIRLDHEPEYKEIPFSEATHEQRMDVSLVVAHDGEKPIDALFTKGGVYVYQFESMWLPVCIHACGTRNDSGLKIRIPT